MGKILQRLGAFRNKAITHTIETDQGHEEFKFYPPRMRMLISGRMREIIEPITQALTTIFADRQRDISKQEEVRPDGSVVTFTQAVNPDVIELREQKRQEAVKKALEALMADNTRWQLGELLADSLRDDFSEDEGTRAKESRKFIDELDVSLLVDFMKGYFKALLPVLDKSGNSILSGLRDTVKREVERAVGKTEVGEPHMHLDVETTEPQNAEPN